MIFKRSTASLCNHCYKEIPAVVEVHRHSEVLLRKTCSEHGAQVGVLERDPVFYTFVSGLRSPSIYNGYFIDVTRRCNLRCEFCYYALEKSDPVGLYSVEAILDECRINAHRGPVIFTGGEPTLHPELPELLSEARKFVGVELLSNGVRLSEPDYFNEVMPLIMQDVNGQKVANLNLSIHRKESDHWQEVIELSRSSGLKIESALIVVDSSESFAEAIEIAQGLSDVVLSFRIKAASRIWDEQKPGSGVDKIFVSDMLDWLERMGERPQFVYERQNKSVFVNVLWGGMFLMLVSWHDTSNVDLHDIECAPYYRARNGEVRNMVTSMLINEGIEKGFCKGQLIAGPAVHVRTPEPVLA